MEAIKERGRQKILIEKDLFGTVRDKVKIAQERLKAFEPSEGYYVADSGGKDSACVLVLCKMAGVRFDSHYNIKRTSMESSSIRTMWRIERPWNIVSVREKLW